MNITNVNNELLELYIGKKLIKRQDADTILQRSEHLGISVPECLLQNEYLTESAIFTVLAEYCGLPFAELDMLEKDDTVFDMFSLEFMKRNCFVPIRTDDSEMVIAVGDPFDINARSAVALAYNGRVKRILTPPLQIERYIDAMAAARSASEVLVAFKNGDSKLFSRKKSVQAKQDDTVSSPAVRLVDSIIKEAIPCRASDIHIEPFEDCVRVRYRIDGDLQERSSLPIEAYQAICARLKIMSGLDIAERRVPQDGRINMTVGSREYDLRVSSLPSVHGEKFVIRILDKSSFRFTRQDLGFDSNENAVIDRMLAHPHGIILLTGPTGCGKSTTLYSFLKEVNDPRVNIVTVEDPVEYTMNGITQTQVNTKASMTFGKALRAILRQDPDIIMIGEIRDEETAEIAVRAAITGHLVFSTLHTNDAPGAITRLEDMRVPDYLVSDALVGVIAQRLVKKLCPACKKRGRTSRSEMQILGLDEPSTIYRPQGCPLCGGSGYKGRTAIHEIMYMNDELKNAVVSTKSGDALRNAAIQNGMTTLWSSCRNLVLSGITGINELITLNTEQ